MLLNLYNLFRREMNQATVLGYFLQALPIACIAGIAYFAIRIVVLKRSYARIKWKQEILRVIFFCYLTGLISLVILPANFWLHFYDGIFFGWWDEMGPVSYTHLGVSIEIWGSSAAALESASADT